MATKLKKSKHILVLLVYYLTITTYQLSAQNTMPQANHVFERKYKIGETYRYKLTMEEWHDGKWDHTNVSICELTVIRDSLGTPYDKVRWISRKTFNTKDTIDLTKLALSVKTYLISLDSKGRIDLPKITVAEMTEPIQDFNTFFIAVSPLIGATKLSKKMDSLIMKEPVKADFSNGSTIVKGEDCITISVKLTGITKNDAMLYTSFFPSLQPCLSFLIQDMNVPVVADTINNFQMALQTGQDKYLVQYGREMFYINSTIRKSDGKIISATMFNKLDLKMKINCDKEYKNCQFEMPFSEQRNLKLELL
jgi:hypothetical protein